MTPLFPLVMCVLLAATRAADVTLSDPVTGATAKVLGQSGKITFALDNQTMQVTIQSLTELDAAGDAVGTTGPADGKHTFNSFASKDFVFSEVFSEDFQGLATSRVNFTATLFGGETNLQVQLILFLETGAVDVHNVTHAVERGSFKYTYYMDYWPFCSAGGSGYTDCTKGSTQQVGAYLDFEIVMKSSSSSSPNITVSNNTAANTSYSVADWSDGAAMVFPGEYEEITSSGVREWKMFPSGYPLFTQQGSKDVTTMRFARFTAAVEYDPLVAMVGPETEDAPTDDTPIDVVPTDDAPTDDVPTDDASTEIVPTDDETIGDVPTEDVSTDDLDSSKSNPKPKPKPKPRSKKEKNSGDDEAADTSASAPRYMFTWKRCEQKSDCAAAYPVSDAFCAVRCLEGACEGNGEEAVCQDCDNCLDDALVAGDDSDCAAVCSQYASSAALSMSSLRTSGGNGEVNQQNVVIWLSASVGVMVLFVMLTVQYNSSPRHHFSRVADSSEHAPTSVIAAAIADGRRYNAEQ